MPEQHHAAAGGMKKKLGPLPMWAWILIAGGSIGIIWYLRSKNAAATPTTGTSIIPDSGAAVPGAGGVDSGSTGTDPTLSDIDAQLAGISAALQALPGGNGITDTGSGTGTFPGEIADVISGIQGIQQLAALFNPPRRGRKKRHNGSGKAGRAGKRKNANTRKTNQHQATGQHRHQTHNSPGPVHVGGQHQHDRTEHHRHHRRGRR